MKFNGFLQYLFIPWKVTDPKQYIHELKRLEWIFISVRWLWVPVVFIMAWLHRPMSESDMWWIGIGFAIVNAAACLLNVKIKSINLQQSLGITMLFIDAVAAWAVIYQFAYDFNTSAYAGFAYIIIEASVRFGLIGGLSGALTFALGLYGAYTYRKLAFDVRFSNSGYTYWTALMFLVAISIGLVVNEWKRQRVQSEYLLRENIILSERQRIARELHDTVLKTLQGLALEARAFGNKTFTTQSVKETAKYIEDICSRTSQEIRETIIALHSDRIAEEIASSLSKMLNEWSRITGIDGEFTLSGQELLLQPDASRQLRNIVSEALINIQRHALASKVHIVMNLSAGELNIEIKDNGHGISRDVDELHTYVAEGKLGIAGMKERAELLGGALSVVSDSTGTCVSFNMPISKYISEEKYS